MDIQWYPGHMTKARRQMQEDLKIIDLIIELVDARTPASGRNPDIQSLGQGKSRLIILNKADMADPEANEKWLQYYRAQGCQVMAADSRSKASLKAAMPLIREACRERIERKKKRGFKNAAIRAMVAGIPNVGKSTFINTCVGRASAKTGNRPGVTKGKQWIHLSKDLDLLDTPGILWPKFDDPDVGIKLALIGSIRDEILNNGELALRLIHFLKKSYPGTLERVYEADESKEDLQNLEDIARRRNAVTKSGELSLDKAADILLNDFRNGKLGRITLELPERSMQ